MEREEQKRLLLYPPLADKCFNLLFCKYLPQLELCGGLTPILERTTRASCDDAETCTSMSLLDETEEPSTNRSSQRSEDSSNSLHSPMVR